MPPTPAKSYHVQFKTPQSKHRLNFTAGRTPHTNPSPNPSNALKETAPLDHPIEVIGRIRNSLDKQQTSNSILNVNSDRQTVRVRADIGYRDFVLDGISLSEEEDIDSFYKKFIEARINGVKLGAKCTIMMYGPTGSGKSHTMFGCGKQPGIVYRSLKDILGDGKEVRSEGDEDSVGTAAFVQVTVLEIYNEEIYDLLSSNGGGGFGIGWPKGGCGSKVRLEVMGKKAKNATFISGNEAGKISKEIQKVEKRRIVKSTQCNDRSSRSHCMIILDVPTVGGRLMLVDMAGSENIEQAGQMGFEAKMQTAKINQGNIALKRVVESIANGDSHVPFRDSKLTMLLQDSFEDDKSKILMILCASPDPRELYKTICTLEYGAKAKCIVRGPHTPIKGKNGAEDLSAVLLGSRIAAMDQFIYKLEMEKKLREKERDEAHKHLLKKEEEIAALRARIEGKGSGATEDEINMKVNERTQMLELDLEKKLLEHRRMVDELVEVERRRMEERILRQQEECEMLRRRLEEVELELCSSRGGKIDENGSRDMDGNNFARRILGAYANEEPGMVKSMDLDMDDQEPFVGDVKHVNGALHQFKSSGIQGFLTANQMADHDDDFAAKFGDKVSLSTVFEEEDAEEEEEHQVNVEDEEVEKEAIEVKSVRSSPRINFDAGYLTSSPQKLEQMPELSGTKLGEESFARESSKDRHLRIQNIFTLCGNYRELSQHIGTPVPAKKRPEDIDPQSYPVLSMKVDSMAKNSNKENTPVQKMIGVLDKWENPEDDHGKFTLKLNGATVAGEEATTLQAIKHSHGHLPLTPLENKLPLT
ncbi:kinesin-II 95 kDa subunit-like [Tripterygium wilfordii]|uniref:Kinesin-like protein KIN-10A n=1 Tax=Tripterygium wilfordii TaxID=458696 RepID=A0A7J7CRK0_TRIWF|nr:kinesin-like protein KIN-10A [Tripterygium wilfordii]KAF5736735.1 kinesin-II 95 kDa subunit-like [Tripterygium wilfordii]